MLDFIGTEAQYVAFLEQQIADLKAQVEDMRKRLRLQDDILHNPKVTPNDKVCSIALLNLKPDILDGGTQDIKPWEVAKAAGVGRSTVTRFFSGMNATGAMDYVADITHKDGDFAAKCKVRLNAPFILDFGSIDTRSIEQRETKRETEKKRRAALIQQCEACGSTDILYGMRATCKACGNEHQLEIYPAAQVEILEDITDVPAPLVIEKREHYAPVPFGKPMPKDFTCHEDKTHKGVTWNPSYSVTDVHNTVIGWGRYECLECWNARQERMKKRGNA